MPNHNSRVTNDVQVPHKQAWMKLHRACLVVGPVLWGGFVGCGFGPRISRVSRVRTRRRYDRSSGKESCPTLPSGSSNPSSSKAIKHLLSRRAVLNRHGQSSQTYAPYTCDRTELLSRDVFFSEMICTLASLTWLLTKSNPAET